MRKRMISAPNQFSGTLDAFYVRYVEPNLPSTQIVEHYHRLLAEYCASPDAVFFIRHMSNTERGATYITERGDRFVATDNAPAWYIHHQSFHEEWIAPGDFASSLMQMPVHFHDVHACIPESINAHGWHVAHIFNVKDGDTAYERWGRRELVGRFIRNVHPCNYFLVAKADWRQFGGDERFIGFFAEVYTQRYRAVWDDFLKLARADTTRIARVSGPIRYEFGLSTPSGAARATVNTQSISKPANRASRRGEVGAQYQSSRLLFKASVIEPLSDHDKFQVVTPHGTFELSKAEFYRAFPNVVQARSYRESGVYHYSAVPKAALEFLVPSSQEPVAASRVQSAHKKLPMAETPKPSAPDRCIMYVDGFNFYYAIKRQQPAIPLYLGWCDFKKLDEAMASDGGAINQVKYFTALVGDLGDLGGVTGSERTRQTIWLDAVRSVNGIEVIEGFHRRGDDSADPHAPKKKREEKQTDVNIAVNMLVDAAKDRCDRLLLITADQDQMPAVKAVQREFGKRVDVWLPPSTESRVPSTWQALSALKGVRVRFITAEMLKKSRLPERIERDGQVIHAPSIWCAPRSQ